MNEQRKQELFRAADGLLARTGRVSLRTLIPLLKKGGSNREVGPALAEWKAAKGYAPALKIKELPVPLQDALAKVAGDLWAAAQAEAAARLTRDRENLAVTVRASEELLAEALDRLDAAEAEIAGLRESVTRAEARLERGRSEEFWDRVMGEIAELIAERGPLTPDEILSGLRTWTIRGAALHKEPLTAGTLRKKMDVRVTHRRYFEAPVDGRYGRREA